MKMKKNNGRLKKSLTIVVSIVLIVSLSQFVFAAGYTNISTGESNAWGSNFTVSSSGYYNFYSYCYSGGGGIYAYLCSGGTIISGPIGVTPGLSRNPVVYLKKNTNYYIWLRQGNTSNPSRGYSYVY